MLSYYYIKIKTPDNPNYCATVVQIKNIIPLVNCDNVVGTTIFGFQAIVQKTTQVGDIGIVFTAETQLSDAYCKHNNLYRHSEKNADVNAKGYIEDNRRIRAVKFRGHQSNCLFMPLSSLGWVASEDDIKWLTANVGVEFDTLHEEPICQKYVIPVRLGRNGMPPIKKISRVDVKHLPEHIDSDNYHKWGDTIPDDKEIIVTQKLHGTSIRIGHTIVKRKRTLVDRIAAFCGATIQDTTHDYVYGSRKVIKDSNNPEQNHYYKHDIWTKEGERLKGLLPQNYIVYGELVGFVGDLPIQKNYTYNVEPGKAELYIYRIAIVNYDGFLTDLSWDQVKEFCRDNGLNHVPEFWRGKKKDFNVQSWMDMRYRDQLAGIVGTLAVPLSHANTVDEGVCIRIDGMRPRILKAKCAKFFEFETKMLDEGTVDMESEQSVKE